MEHTFKVGEVVMLKSSGPKMTVDRITDNVEGRVKVTCIWFEDYTKPSNHTFDSFALRSVNAKLKTDD